MDMVVDVKDESPGTKDLTILSATGSKVIIDKVFKKLLQSEKEALEAENQKRTALNDDNYIDIFQGNQAEVLLFSSGVRFERLEVREGKSGLYQ
jgi:hypothetical protein